MSGRVAVVLGTRPEIIKLAGVLDELGERALLIHTGQHYDDVLSGAFLEDLGLPAPAVALGLGGGSRAAQIGRGVVELGRILPRIEPVAVVVQGDTNSALAGALAANASVVPLVHVEAGLRSFDRAMPEEHNRVMIDHVADLLAAPTDEAVANLAREGLRGDRVIKTGNTVVEAVHRQLPDPARRAGLLAEHGLESNRFVLATIHRPENTDSPRVLADVLEALGRLPTPVLLPLHPRTAAAVERADLSHLLDPLIVCPPLAGPEFLGLAAESAVIVTDSGGIQEEATVIARPVVVVRRSTERPEAFEHHATLARPDQIVELVDQIIVEVSAVHERLARLPSPYGDGLASARIVAETLRLFDT